MALSSDRRVAVIGLDCVPPHLAFDEYAERMPNLSRLRREGVWGPMRSCDPPITVPAWQVMFSGRSPGRLGVYGFRNRADYSYRPLALATSRSVREERAWDRVGRHGGRSILLGVPQTYPARPISGDLVSGFLAPSTDSEFTYPRDLREEIFRVAPGYMLDVVDYRTEHKARLLDDLYRMMRARFTVARHLVTSRDFNLFAMVEMGTDRIHHGFWRLCRPEHPRHPGDNPFRNAMVEYYAAVDEELGRLLEALGAGTDVLVVSDHGAKAMKGAFAVNEWLRRTGWLHLASEPPEGTPIDECDIDWTRTRAWGEGGYYARIFFNVRGREPRGIIDPDGYESACNELAAQLGEVRDWDGEPIGPTVFTPDQLYDEVRGVPPDLIAYFGDLAWRAAGTLGHGTVLLGANDTGPDDANHDWEGIFVGRPAGGLAGGGEQRSGLSLPDVSATLLTQLGLDLPDGHLGKPVSLSRTASEQGDEE